MDQVERLLLEEDFLGITEDMDIPEARRIDFAWLDRNIGIINGSHPQIEKAKKLIKLLSQS